MGVELVPIRDGSEMNISGSNGWDIALALAEYASDISGLGVASRLYECGDFIRGRKGQYGFPVWIVLTPEVSDRGLSAEDMKRIHQCSRSLRAEIAQNHLPIEVHPTIVRASRFSALLSHLRRKDINASYYDFDDFKR